MMNRTISVIVPTRNEGSNPHALTARVTSVCGEEDYEIIFVDASSDPRSLAVLSHLSQTVPGVRVLPQTSRSGLAGAVLEGVQAAKGEYLIVMDGDLQHPPELIPYLLDALRRGDDLCVGARAQVLPTSGFSSLLRARMSDSATHVAHWLLPGARKTPDPMSGYFACRASAIGDISDLRPVGFKILLEILCRRPALRVSMAPYGFGCRQEGVSKFSGRVFMQFGLHLARLFLLRKGARYAFVGALGAGVNVVVMQALLGAGIPALGASLGAGWAALVFNFLTNNGWTWSDIGSPRLPYWSRLLVYVLVALLGLGSTAFVMLSLRDLGILPILGQAVGIGVTSVWTFQAHKRLTFRPRVPRGTRSA
ncbi:glycosyltransferase [Alicyclobacillus sp. SP_1]|uniref:glycosyltransferase n=1 Tax=Alicyclobacillus sp. SP_1 TaxID=2942475 RepID=UPI002157AB77|nr:glycosyltransferase [Alicyclobacillus sp. SP_1]